MGSVDLKKLKRDGFMEQVQKNHFSMRLRSVAGQLSAEELEKIAAVARTYGKGYIHLTSRQGVEIPFIKLEDIENVISELGKAGMGPGACGPRVRTVTACQGSAICQSGLIDTTQLAKEIDERYFGRELPHKFKIGVTGCRNNCLKAEENDIGVKGAMKPQWIEEACVFCGVCERVCPGHAIAIDQEKGELTYRESDCLYCGKCVKACPVNAWAGKSGYIAYFGGRFGNRIIIGRQLLPVFLSKEELFQAMDEALAFFNGYAKPGERFSAMIERVGWGLLEERLNKATGVQ